MTTTCLLDIMLITENGLPALRHPKEDTAKGKTEIALCEEDRRIVLDGLREWAALAETKTLIDGKPTSGQAVLAKIWQALHQTTDGFQFSDWRNDYSKGAKHLAMSIAMAGPSKK